MAHTSDRDLLLQFLGSLALCEYMGDAADDAEKVLKTLGIATPHANDAERWWDGLRRDLHALGVTTLYGTALWDESDEEK